MRILISLLLTLLPYVGLQAHHNTQAEFGAFGLSDVSAYGTELVLG